MGGYINPLPLIVLDGVGRDSFPARPYLKSMRETTISVSRAEKAALDEAKLELYQTEEVPYGAVICELAGRYIDDK